MAGTVCKFANNAVATLAGAITNVATSLAVSAGQGAKFPTVNYPVDGSYFYAAIEDENNAIEIIQVQVHAAGSDTFATVVRSQGGTTAPVGGWAAGVMVENRPTAETNQNFAQLDTSNTFTQPQAVPAATASGHAVNKGQADGLYVPQTSLTGGDVGGAPLVLLASVTAINGNASLPANSFSYSPWISRITATSIISLPAASTVPNGDRRIFKSKTTGDVTFAPNGADTIDGVNASYRLPSYSDIELVSDGVSDWSVLRRPHDWVGKIVQHGKSTVGIGYVNCDGSSLSTTTYAGLFAEIGYTFGGSGANFNVPDYRDRVPVGAGSAPTVIESPANITVAANAVPVASNNTKWITGMPVAVTNSTITGLPSGNYWIVRVDATHVSFASSLANAQNGTVLAISGANVGCTITLTLTARTLGEVGGEEAHAQSSTELLAHVHTFAMDYNGGTETNPARPPRGDTNFMANTPTASTGGNAAANIMQPFLVCNYAIKT